MGGHGAEPRAEPARQLAYRFDFGQSGKVHVTLETSSPPGGAEVLELPSRWADATHLEGAIVNLKITGSGVSLEPMGGAARYVMHGRPGTMVRLDYDLQQDWTGAFREGQRHRVLLRPETVVFNGENGLVAPHLPAEARVEASFDFANLPSGQTPVTSFGTSSYQTMSGTWSEVSHAMFAAGEFSLRRLNVDGASALLAHAGTWSFSEGDLATRVLAILRAERRFWGGTFPQGYALVLLPFETGTWGGGGSAFTNASTVFLSPGETLGPEAESLIAHEVFHAWNPGRLGTVAETQSLGWFAEGFTTYYQDVMLQRGGLITRPAYVKRLNALLRDSVSAGELRPALEEPGISLDDAEMRYREPYLRGASLAMWANAAIARASGGRQSLDDAMRLLLAEGMQPLTAERIFQAIGRVSDPATERRLRQIVEETRPVPLEAGDTVGPCLVLEQATVWSFALGLPTTQLARGAVLREVDPESSAYRAGLREGQTLLGWSLRQGDVDHEVVLQVQTAAGTHQQIRFLPRGRQVTTLQAKVLSGCAE